MPFGNSLLVAYYWPAIFAEVNDFGCLGIFGRLQAKVQKNALTTKLSLKCQFRGMVGLTSADNHRTRLKVGQELKNIEVEAGPDRFAVVLATNDLLHCGKGPNLPSIAAGLGLGRLKADLQRGRMPLPTIDDFFLKCFKPFLGHDSLRSPEDLLFFSDVFGPHNYRLFHGKRE